MVGGVFTTWIYNVENRIGWDYTKYNAYIYLAVWKKDNKDCVSESETEW